MSPGPHRPPFSQAGQATPEYVGLVLLIVTIVGVVAAVAGMSPPGGGLARAVASKLLCAVDREGDCADVAGLPALSPLERAYGGELAAMLVDRAPDIYFEDDDFVSMPVDYRECRRRACADSIRVGHLRLTQTGLRPTAYVHVVDCREPGGPGIAGEEPDCAGARAGHVYLQYWLYYPDSLTHGLGRLGGFHDDDWESYQVRVDEGGGAVARASSHHGYNGRSGGPGSVASDAGWAGKPGWDTILNSLHVASGSHAGMTLPSVGDSREIPRSELRLIPLEPIARSGEAPDFAIPPPWEKGVWDDPESTGT